MATSMREDLFALVSNIPNSFHSRDLRNYFSQFVEERKFRCFHFRNRPEQKLQKGLEHGPMKETLACRNFQAQSAVFTSVCGVDSVETPPFTTCHDPATKPTDGQTQSLFPTVNEELHRGRNEEKTNEKYSNPMVIGEQSRRPKRKCCIIKISPQNLKRLLQLYHKKPWVDQSGNAMGIRCFVVGIKVSHKQDPSSSTSLGSFTQDDLHKLPELNPPDIMPHGNVGTPTQSFLQLIRECKMPPSVIKKLGLSFPKRCSNRMYGNVPFQYTGNVVPGSSTEVVVEVAKTGTGEEIVDVTESDHEKLGPTTGETLGPANKRNHGLTLEEADSGEDDDTCEEWERHEAFHDDVTKQDRTGERLFEEEMEIVWDKGSSGLVFYTDAAYWDAMKGDFDERTSDEWDVDMSIFYEKDGGTKDARDWLQIQRERRRGEDNPSVFTKKPIGQFENHTKGFGRQLMSELGWRDGEGLGKDKRGMPEALKNDGQTSRDKRGFGYLGEKLCRYPVKKKRTEGAIISTVYDRPEEVDPPATLLRSVEPTHLKHRQEIL